jgi:hypothetical protein
VGGIIVENDMDRLACRNLRIRAFSDQFASCPQELK